ncbi:hypothetical protein [Streptomyces coeruleorubidus]|uniref:hypothetical protein n=1 Tax=Streptomyces coeruleorubidus TaxID=116188 RepID=UPI0037BD0EC9
MAQRAVTAQPSWDDPDQQPGKPCPCGGADSLHGKECDREDGAVLTTTDPTPRA